jgi:hypothetical protein
MVADPRHCAAIPCAIIMPNRDCVQAAARARPRSSRPDRLQPSDAAAARTAPLLRQFVLATVSPPQRHRPRFSASRKCRENAGARAAPQSRVVGSAAPQHLSKRLIWLTISRSPPAAARRRLARRLVTKLQRNSRETDEMSGRRRPAARRLRAPHDAAEDLSLRRSTAYTIGRSTAHPCEAGKSRRQHPPGSPLAGVRA